MLIIRLAPLPAVASELAPLPSTLAHGRLQDKISMDSVYEHE